MSSRGAALALALVGAAALAAPAAAQSCNAAIPAGTCSLTTTTSFTIGPALQLTVSAASTILTTPQATDFDAGFTTDAGPTVTVQGNQTWTVQVGTSQAAWTASGAGARPNKPAGDLEWGLAAGGPFQSVSLTAQALGTGTRTAGTSYTVFYRTLYSWTLDTPGTYSLPVTFTLVTP